MTKSVRHYIFTMTKQWWGYLHSNGQILLKYWSGDVGDYTTDCEGNDFVIKAIPPFEAHDRTEAFLILVEKLNE
jgi:hypothetical protein